MPSRKKISFAGHQGDVLAGTIELPDDKPKTVALFAHCFTCGKDVVAASRIARKLVAKGFAVLRFDFTGLGGSEGDFSNTNFTSNVEDLLQAADYLRAHYEAPQILIGHSLGGTAILNAAAKIPESRGVVTIGSPADAQHVSQQFADALKEIETKGEAQVRLGGRPFLIRKQFVDDIRNTSVESIRALKKAFLIMHAPQDNIVSVREAEKIYQAASHPKSFVSLDDADHLLSRKHDADYVASLISSWSSRFLENDNYEKDPDKHRNKSADREATGLAETVIAKIYPGRLLASEVDHKFTIKLQTDRHEWLADEPAGVGGSDKGPDPYDLLLASVSACTAMTLRMYAQRKGWPVEDVNVAASHSRQHINDCEDCEGAPKRIEKITRHIAIKGDLTTEQRQRMMVIADKCPVHRTLTGEFDIESQEMPFS